MLTIHHPGGGVRAEPHGPVAPGHAVVVDGGRLAALGPYEDVLGAYPGARVREWDGVLEPGRFEPDAGALLEHRYWPDPREADEWGTDPLPAADVPMDGPRWGGSARRGVQRMLARGVTAVEGPFTRPQVAAAVRRAGLRGSPGTLVVPADADFTVTASDGSCLVTVVGGRLVHRRA